MVVSVHSETNNHANITDSQKALEERNKPRFIYTTPVKKVRSSERNKSRFIYTTPVKKIRSSDFEIGGSDLDSPFLPSCPRTPAKEFVRIQVLNAGFTLANGMYRPCGSNFWILEGRGHLPFVLCYGTLWEGQLGWILKGTFKIGNQLRETHLYSCADSNAPPKRGGGKIPLEGWETVVGNEPLPIFKVKPVSTNSETVMHQKLLEIASSVSDRKYTKAQLLGVRPYFQDMPDGGETLPRVIIRPGVGKSLTVKLLTKERLVKRKKQINLGKNTTEYKAYIEAVPKNKRPVDAPVTPPLKPRKVDPASASKRRWSGRLRSWRRQLHHYKIPSPEEIERLYQEKLSKLNQTVSSENDKTCESLSKEEKTNLELSQIDKIEVTTRDSVMSLELPQTGKRRDLR